MKTEFLKLRERITAKDPTLMDDSFIKTLPRLLEMLGHPSEDFRDTLGWSTLSAYFRSSLCPESVRPTILEILLSDKFLFLGIDNGETIESVKRSFASLTIADILIGDITNGSKLDVSKVNLVSQELCRYISMETDWRGRDSTLGWIHAIAHVADAFWALAAHPSLKQDDMENCFLVMLSYLEKRGQSAFLWQEDYRLGRALATMLEKLPEELGKDLIEKRYQRSELFAMPALQNILGTLRCVYLELHWSSSKKINLMDTIKGIIF